MAATVRAGATGITNIVIPAGILAGDLILLYLGNYNSVPSIPVGYSSIGAVSATGSSNNAASRLVYKVANGTESGTTITPAVGNVFSIVLIAYVGNPGFTAPTVSGNVGLAATSVVQAGTPNPVNPSKHLIFITAMTNSGGGSGTYPDITSPDPYTRVYNINSSNGFIASALMVRNVNEVAGASDTPTIYIRFGASSVFTVIHITDLVTTYSASASLTGQPSYLSIPSVLYAASSLLNKVSSLVSKVRSTRVTPWTQPSPSSTLWVEPTPPSTSWDEP